MSDVHFSLNSKEKPHIYYRGFETIQSDSTSNSMNLESLISKYASSTYGDMLEKLARSDAIVLSLDSDGDEEELMNDINPFLSHTTSKKATPPPSNSLSTHNMDHDSVDVTFIKQIPGHIATVCNKGKYLLLLDAVPSSHALTPLEQERLTHFVRTNKDANIPNVLAINTGDATISDVHFLQFKGPRVVVSESPVITENEQLNKSSLLPIEYHEYIRLLVFLTDGSLLIWEWSVACYSWTFITKTHLPVNTTVRDSLTHFNSLKLDLYQNISLLMETIIRQYIYLRLDEEANKCAMELQEVLDGKKTKIKTKKKTPKPRNLIGDKLKKLDGSEGISEISKIVDEGWLDEVVNMEDLIMVWDSIPHMDHLVWGVSRECGKSELIHIPQPQSLSTIFPQSSVSLTEENKSSTDKNSTDKSSTDKSSTDQNSTDSTGINDGQTADSGYSSLAPFHLTSTPLSDPIVLLWHESNTVTSSVNSSFFPLSPEASTFFNELLSSLSPLSLPHTLPRLPLTTTPSLTSLSLFSLDTLTSSSVEKVIGDSKVISHHKLHSLFQHDVSSFFPDRRSLYTIVSTLFSKSSTHPNSHPNSSLKPTIDNDNTNVVWASKLASPMLTFEKVFLDENLHSKGEGDNCVETAGYNRDDTVSFHSNLSVDEMKHIITNTNNNTNEKTLNNTTTNESDINIKGVPSHPHLNFNPFKAVSPSPLPPTKPDTGLSGGSDSRSRRDSSLHLSHSHSYSYSDHLVSSQNNANPDSDSDANTHSLFVSISWEDSHNILPHIYASGGHSDFDSYTSKTIHIDQLGHLLQDLPLSSSTSLSTRPNISSETVCTIGVREMEPTSLLSTARDLVLRREISKRNSINLTTDASTDSELLSLEVKLNNLDITHTDLLSPSRPHPSTLGVNSLNENEPEVEYIHYVTSSSSSHLTHDLHDLLNTQSLVHSPTAPQLGEHMDLSTYINTHHFALSSSGDQPLNTGVDAVEEVSVKDSLFFTDPLYTPPLPHSSNSTTNSTTQACLSASSQKMIHSMAVVRASQYITESLSEMKRVRDSSPTSSSMPSTLTSKLPTNIVKHSTNSNSSLSNLSMSPSISTLPSSTINSSFTVLPMVHDDSDDEISPQSNLALDIECDDVSPSDSLNDLKLTLQRASEKGIVYHQHSNSTFISTVQYPSQTSQSSQSSLILPPSFNDRVTHTYKGKSGLYIVYQRQHAFAIDIHTHTVYITMKLYPHEPSNDLIIDPLSCTSYTIPIHFTFTSPIPAHSSSFVKYIPYFDLAKTAIQNGSTSTSSLSPEGERLVNMLQQNLLSQTLLKSEDDKIKEKDTEKDQKKGKESEKTKDKKKKEKEMDKDKKEGETKKSLFKTWSRNKSLVSESSTTSVTSDDKSKSSEGIDVGDDDWKRSEMELVMRNIEECLVRETTWPLDLHVNTVGEEGEESCVVSNTCHVIDVDVQNLTQHNQHSNSKTKPKSSWLMYVLYTGQMKHILQERRFNHVPIEEISLPHLQSQTNSKINPFTNRPFSAHHRKNSHFDLNPLSILNTSTLPLVHNSSPPHLPNNVQVGVVGNCLVWYISGSSSMDEVMVDLDDGEVFNLSDTEFNIDLDIAAMDFQFPDDNSSQSEFQSLADTQSLPSNTLTLVPLPSPPHLLPLPPHTDYVSLLCPTLSLVNTNSLGYVVDTFAQQLLQLALQSKHSIERIPVDDVVVGFTSDPSLPRSDSDMSLDADNPCDMSLDADNPCEDDQVTSPLASLVRSIPCISVDTCVAQTDILRMMLGLDSVMDTEDQGRLDVDSVLKQSQLQYQLQHQLPPTFNSPRPNTSIENRELYHDLETTHGKTVSTIYSRLLTPSSHQHSHSMLRSSILRVRASNRFVSESSTSLHTYSGVSTVIAVRERNIFKIIENPSLSLDLNSYSPIQHPTSLTSHCRAFTHQGDVTFNASITSSTSSLSPIPSTPLVLPVCWSAMRTCQGCGTAVHIDLSNLKSDSLITVSSLVKSDCDSHPKKNNKHSNSSSTELVNTIYICSQCDELSKTHFLKKHPECTKFIVMKSGGGKSNTETNSQSLYVTPYLFPPPMLITAQFVTQLETPYIEADVFFSQNQSTSLQLSLSPSLTQSTVQLHRQHVTLLSPITSADLLSIPPHYLYKWWSHMLQTVLRLTHSLPLSWLTHVLNEIREKYPNALYLHRLQTPNSLMSDPDSIDSQRDVLIRTLTTHLYVTLYNLPTDSNTIQSISSNLDSLPFPLPLPSLSSILSIPANIQAAHTYSLVTGELIQTAFISLQSPFLHFSLPLHLPDSHTTISNYHIPPSLTFHYLSPLSVTSPTPTFSSDKTVNRGSGYTGQTEYTLTIRTSQTQINDSETNDSANTTSEVLDMTRQPNSDDGEVIFSCIVNPSLSTYLNHAISTSPSSKNNCKLLHHTPYYTPLITNVMEGWSSTNGCLFISKPSATGMLVRSQMKSAINSNFNTNPVKIDYNQTKKPALRSQDHEPSLFQHLSVVLCLSNPSSSRSPLFRLLYTLNSIYKLSPGPLQTLLSTSLVSFLQREVKELRGSKRKRLYLNHGPSSNLSLMRHNSGANHDVRGNHGDRTNANLSRSINLSRTNSGTAGATVTQHRPLSKRLTNSTSLLLRSINRTKYKQSVLNSSKSSTSKSNLKSPSSSSSPSSSPSSLFSLYFSPEDLQDVVSVCGFVMPRLVLHMFLALPIHTTVICLSTPRLHTLGRALITYYTHTHILKPPHKSQSHRNIPYLFTNPQSQVRQWRVMRQHPHTSLFPFNNSVGVDGSSPSVDPQLNNIHSIFSTLYRIIHAHLLTVRTIAPPTVTITKTDSRSSTVSLSFPPSLYHSIPEYAGVLSHTSLPISPSIVLAAALAFALPSPPQRLLPSLSLLARANPLTHINTAPPYVLYVMKTIVSHILNVRKSRTASRLDSRPHSSLSPLNYSEENTEDDYTLLLTDNNLAFGHSHPHISLSAAVEMYNRACHANSLSNKHPIMDSSYPQGLMFLFEVLGFPFSREALSPPSYSPHNNKSINFTSLPLPLYSVLSSLHCTPQHFSPDKCLRSPLTRPPLSTDFQSYLRDRHSPSHTDVESLRDLNTLHSLPDLKNGLLDPLNSPHQSIDCHPEYYKKTDLPSHASEASPSPSTTAQLRVVRAPIFTTLLQQVYLYFPHLLLTLLRTITETVDDTFTSTSFSPLQPSPLSIGIGVVVDHTLFPQDQTFRMKEYEKYVSFTPLSPLSRTILTHLPHSRQFRKIYLLSHMYLKLRVELKNVLDSFVLPLHWSKLVWNCDITTDNHGRDVRQLVLTVKDDIRQRNTLKSDWMQLQGVGHTCSCYSDDWLFDSTHSHTLFNHYSALMESSDKWCVYKHALQLMASCPLQRPGDMVHGVVQTVLSVKSQSPNPPKEPRLKTSSKLLQFIFHSPPTDSHPSDSQDSPVSLLINRLCALNTHSHSHSLVSPFIHRHVSVCVAHSDYQLFINRLQAHIDVLVAAGSVGEAVHLLTHTIRSLVSYISPRLLSLQQIVLSNSPTDSSENNTVSAIEIIELLVCGELISHTHSILLTLSVWINSIHTHLSAVHSINQRVQITRNLILSHLTHLTHLTEQLVTSSLTSNIDDDLSLTDHFEVPTEHLKKKVENWFLDLDNGVDVADLADITQTIQTGVHEETNATSGTSDYHYHSLDLDDSDSDSDSDSDDHNKSYQRTDIDSLTSYPYTTHTINKKPVSTDSTLSNLSNNSFSTRVSALDSNDALNHSHSHSIMPNMSFADLSFLSNSNVDLEHNYMLNASTDYSKPNTYSSRSQPSPSPSPSSPESVRLTTTMTTLFILSQLPNNILEIDNKDINQPWYTFTHNPTTHTSLQYLSEYIQMTINQLKMNYGV